jgi:hypothetical protein
VNEWEYNCEVCYETTAHDIATWLNIRGNTGWELVTTINNEHIFVFKRPKQYYSVSRIGGV